ncbi:hypothetical protein MKX01_015210, partial [Papaver californicum]
TPDLLLLDEPINHLDLDTIEWIEGYLNKKDVPMGNHSQYIIAKEAADMGVSRTFEGNYSQYILAKEQKQIDHTKDIIYRLGAGANADRASTAEKNLEKLQEEEQIEKPFQRKQMKIRFPERGRSGQEVVAVKSLQFGFEEKGGEGCNLGPSGCGMSILLILIMGLEKPEGGEVEIGEHNILPNYFEQNQKKLPEDWRLDDMKGLLGRCNFKSDMLDRKVSLLSGGEKARLAFCKFMVKPSTLLVLDEPTNHLDITSTEMLEEVISEYKGTVITVSYDRYFIKQIVNRVVEVKDRNLQDYAGDYNVSLVGCNSNLDARDKALEREAELDEKKGAGRKQGNCI